MKHIEDICVLVQTLLKSKRFHCLIIEGPPGWGKSTTVGNVLRELLIPFQSVGAYITPLELFKALRDEPDALHVLDDSEGVLTTPTALSILKAATWSGVGSQSTRQVSWTSPASGLSGPFEFRGKLILLTNGTSGAAEKTGLGSRSLHFQMRLSRSAMGQILVDAAKNKERFPDQTISQAVADFLVKRIEHGVPGINLRTLELGYELAQVDPNTWACTMMKLLPGVAPEHLIEQLSSSDLPVERQAQTFSQATGLSRRTFFNYRRLAREST